MIQHIQHLFSHNDPTHSTRSVLSTLRNEAFENIVGKGESTLSKTNLSFVPCLGFLQQNAFVNRWVKHFVMWQELAGSKKFQKLLLVPLPLCICPTVRQRIMPLTHSHTMTPFDAPGKQAF